MITDEFSGDNVALVESIKALVSLNDDGALVPHGIGGHARSLLAAAACRLAAPTAPAAGPQQAAAWSPRLDYPGYEKQRVWANGRPSEADIDYWQKNGQGVDLAYLHPTPAVERGVAEGEVIPDGALESIWDSTALKDDRVLAYGRAVALEVGARYSALVAALKTHAGDTDGWQFGLGRVRFDAHGQPAEFLWATQDDINSAIDSAMGRK